MQTRCPFCQTLFHVTPEQLKMHAGRVRCGHCRQVFNAFEHLNNALSPKKAPSLKDIAPSVEIQFGHSLSEERVQLNLDDQELASLQKLPPAPELEQEAEIRIDLEEEEIPHGLAALQKNPAPSVENLAPAQTIPVAAAVKAPVAPAPIIATPPAPSVPPPVAPPPVEAPAPVFEAPQIANSPAEPSKPVLTFDEPEVDLLPTGQRFNDFPPVSVAPENLQLDIELAPSVVPDSIEIDIPPSVAPESIAPEEPLPPEEPPEPEEVALPEINPNFDVEVEPEPLPPLEEPQEEIKPLPPQVVEAQVAQPIKPAEPIKAAKPIPKPAPQKTKEEFLMEKIKAMELEFEAREKEERRKAKKNKKSTEEKPAVAQKPPKKEVSIPPPSEPPKEAHFSTAEAGFFSKSDLLVNDPIFTPTPAPAAAPVAFAVNDSLSDEIQENINRLDEEFKQEWINEPEPNLLDSLIPSVESSITAPVFQEENPPPPWHGLEKLSKPKRKKTSSKYVWTVSVLSILLFLQVAFFFKEIIVEEVPALRTVYQSLGITLPLQRELKLLTIESSDLNIDSENGIFKLQATLGNRARFNQAWPNLELVLTDTFDQALLKRTLQPGDYLKNPENPFFKAQSEDHIQLWLQAKNVEAVGYRLSVFYPKG